MWRIIRKSDLTEYDLPDEVAQVEDDGSVQLPENDHDAIVLVRQWMGSTSLSQAPFLLCQRANAMRLDFSTLRP